MDVKSEGLDISIPRISRSYHAPVESLTENERGLRKEILKRLLQLLRNKQSFLCIR